MDIVLLTQGQVAAMIGVKEGTLEKWRHRRIGPRFARLVGGVVRYRREDVEKFIDEEFQRSQMGVFAKETQHRGKRRRGRPRLLDGQGAALKA